MDARDGRAARPRLHVDRACAATTGRSTRVCADARARARPRSVGRRCRSRTSGRRGGRLPGGVSSKLERRAAPRTSAPTARGRGCCMRLPEVIEENLPGTLADVDSEFLHDLRVAVRRTRVGSSASCASVFPPERARALPRRVPLAAAGHRADARPRRLPARLRRASASALPEAQRADLEPLRTAARRAPAREQRRDGARAAIARASRRCSRTGRRSSTGSSTRRRTTGPTPRGRSPTLAGERIARVYRRMVKAGPAIDDASPPRRCTTCARRARSCATCSSSSPPSIPADGHQADGPDAQGAAGHARPLPGPRGAGGHCCARCGDDVAALDGRRRPR